MNVQVEHDQVVVLTGVFAVGRGRADEGKVRENSGVVTAKGRLRVVRVVEGLEADTERDLLGTLVDVGGRDDDVERISIDEEDDWDDKESSESLLGRGGGSRGGTCLELAATVLAFKEEEPDETVGLGREVDGELVTTLSFSARSISDCSWPV